MSQPTLRTQADMDRRTNKYPSTCVRCNKRVEPEQGWMALQNGQWDVWHQNDCTKQVVEPAPAPAAEQFKVADGRYTIQFADGDYRTLRVSTQPLDANFMAGRVLISYLSGPNNGTDYTTFANVTDGGGVKVWSKHQDNASLREALKVLIDAPGAARLAYAEASGCCSRCGRTLTVPSSLHQGLGPECAKKVSG